jgi:hypothetical protein
MKKRAAAVKHIRVEQEENLRSLMMRGADFSAAVGGC